jgi:DNA-binding GntR family transcriptional regulator
MLRRVNPLERSSTATRVAGVLRERIAKGELTPGSRVVELEISRELGVSRSPVREALLKLAEEGLVAIFPYRGAIVAPLQRERLAELLEFRLALEHFALDRLVERDDVPTLQALRKQVDAIREATRKGNRKRAVDEDLAAHRTMVAASGNALLQHAYEGVLAQIRLYIDVTSARYARAEDLADEHDALLIAIERGDATAARELLDAHIMHGW